MRYVALQHRVEYVDNDWEEMDPREALQANKSAVEHQARQLRKNPLPNDESLVGISCFNTCAHIQHGQNTFGVCKTSGASLCSAVQQCILASR